MAAVRARTSLRKPRAPWESQATVKTPSAWDAARSRPGSETPAWKITGCFCGGVGMFSGPSTRNHRSSWLIFFIWEVSVYRPERSATIASAGQDPHSSLSVSANSPARA